MPTARASLVLDEAPLPSEQADANDGFNTVGFSSYEGFVDAWFIGLAFWRQEGDRLVGCDIELNPAMFEVLDQRAVDNPEKDMERLAWLEMVVVHEARSLPGARPHRPESDLGGVAGGPPRRAKGSSPKDRWLSLRNR